MFGTFSPGLNISVHVSMDLSIGGDKKEKCILTRAGDVPIWDLIRGFVRIRKTRDLGLLRHIVVVFGSLKAVINCFFAAFTCMFLTVVLLWNVDGYNHKCQEILTQYNSRCSVWLGLYFLFVYELLLWIVQVMFLSYQGICQKKAINIC